MVGNPSAHGDTDGADFTLAQPNTSFAVAACSYEVEGGEGANDDFFQIAQIRVQIATCLERDDRVAYDLAWAMISDITARLL
jgi:hypothetical protein